MKLADIKRFDIVVYLLWTIFFVLFLSTYDYTGASLTVIFTFYLIGIISFIMSIKPQRSVSIKRNIYIFYLIFFFFAPMQQYVSGTRLWITNGMMVVYEDSDYFFANICILISIFMFEFGSYYVNRKISKNMKKSTRQMVYQARRNRMASLSLLTVIVIFSAILIIGTKGLSLISYDSPIISQIKHMILFAPVICLIVSLMNFKGGEKKSKIYVMFFAAVCVVLFACFSGTMARFIMLGAVMAVLSYYMADNKTQSLYFSIYVAGFFFAFSMLRYKNIFSGNILSFVDFCYYDYDAYQIFMLVIHYVKSEGITWGMNLLSALFCLIPRRFAPWRLEATGGIVMSYAGSWFKNVSCPITAEMYFGFGIPGIIVLSFLLGYGVSFLDSRYDGDNCFHKGVFSLVSGMSIYIMRGSFLASFSYTLGIILAYYLIFKVVYFKIKIKDE